MKSLICTFAVCALLLWGVRSVSAQPSGPSDTEASIDQSQGNAAAGARRPFRGLFGGPSNSRNGRSLVLSGSIFGAYDDNVLAGQGQHTTVTSDQLRGFYSGAQGDLAYSQESTNRSFAIDGGFGGRYYPEFNRFSPIYHEGARFGSTLGRRTSLSVSQQFLYTPNYRFSLFPGTAGADNPDEGIDTSTQFDLFQRTAYRHSGSLSLSRDLSQVSSISADGSVRYVNFTDSSFRDFASYSAGAAYDRRLTEHATLVLGYHYRRADYSLVGTHSPAVHNIDVGVDYSRNLSLTRRTTFSFSTGSSIVNSRSFVDGELQPQNRLRFRVSGSASLEREIGRTWSANLQYQRGLRFREGFDEPFYSDVVSAGIGGLMSRRVEASAGTAYAHSTLVSGGNRGYGAFTASSRLQYAMTRSLAVYASYYYYQYRFRGDIVLDPRLASAAHRNGVQVGLSAMVPLFR